ncbi:MAG: phosphoribosylformylglycinamidine synthase subunit PurS, partial [Planctomycetota bacterium]
MLWRIEVSTRPGYLDVEGHSALSQIHDFGIDAAGEVSFSIIYDVLAEISEDRARLIADALLADPVLNEYKIRRMDR